MAKVILFDLGNTVYKSGEDFRPISGGGLICFFRFGGKWYYLKAIIMAGGRGTRLMPISALSPKPMTKLMGLPLLEHIVELLRNNGFTEICMTLGHMPEQIVDYFGNGKKFGVSIEYRVEEKPLGTAGGVRACADFACGEDFLVISGDAACDFDLNYLAKRHKQNGADVSMALYSHPEPLRYGTVLVSGSYEIRKFIEKPSWQRVVTDMVNTGIYIISPKIIELIPEGETSDFARDLFPYLMERGYKMFGVPLDGYWCDIGDSKSYLHSCMDALDGVLKISKTADGDYFPKTRSFVCRGAEVDESAEIEHSIIHAGSKIGANTRVINSVVDAGMLGDGCFINGTVVCSGAEVEDGAATEHGAVVAACGTDMPKLGIEQNEFAPSGKRGLCRELACAGRAALMRELSNVLWEIGADFSDGITVDDGNCRVHISPMEEESAISVEAIGGREKERISTLQKYCWLAQGLDATLNGATIF